MPKSKKTKAKHQDFQKVKLKVGRKLPRAANETVAAFKSRNIQIKGQFSSGDAQPTSKKKHNIKELLGQLNHYNSSFRYEALKGLKELLVLNPDLIHTHLASILEKSSDMILDKDHNVRALVLKLFELIFPVVPEHKMTPFFPVLSAQICCAMTHIHADIQADSLPVIDICLEHYSLLVTKSGGKILSNFLQQISKKTDDSKSGSGRSLLTNPHQRTTNQKWRLQVLQRVEKFLLALIKNNSHGKSMEKCFTAADFVVDGNRECDMLVLGLDAWEWTSQQFTLKELCEGVNSNEDQVPHYIQNLVPLLLDCWKEAAPSQGQGSVLSTEAFSVLLCVVNTIQCIMDYIQMVSTTSPANNIGAFLEKYKKDLTQQIFSGFPYSIREGMGRDKFKRNKNSTDTSVSVLSLNLSITHVMSSLLSASPASSHSSTHSGPSHKVVSRLVEFMTSVFHQSKFNADQMRVAMEIMSKIVPVCRAGQLGELLAAVCEMWQGRHSLSHHQLPIHHLLSSLVLHTTQPDCSQTPSIQQWMSALPSHFLQITVDKKTTQRDTDITAQLVSYVFDLIQQLGVRGHGCLLEALSDHYVDMLDMSVIAALSDQDRRRIINLLLLLPSLSDCVYRALLWLWINRTVAPEDVCYLLQILQYRFSQQQAESADITQVSVFVSFLLSVAMGTSSEKLREGFHSCVDDSQVPMMSLPVKGWPGHVTVIQLVLCGVQMVSSVLSEVGGQSEGQIRELVLSTLHSTQEKSIQLPAASFYALVSLSTRFSINVDTPLPVHHLSNLATCIVTLVTVAVALDNKREETATVVADILSSCVSCMKTIPGITAAYLHSYQTALEGGPSAEKVGGIISGLLMLLQLSVDARVVFSREKEALQTILHTITTLHPELTSGHQFNALKYEVSLL